jgi:hypothetical protein
MFRPGFAALFVTQDFFAVARPGGSNISPSSTAFFNNERLSRLSAPGHQTRFSGINQFSCITADVKASSRIRF